MRPYIFSSLLFLAHLLTGMFKQTQIQQLCGLDHTQIFKAACNCFRRSAFPAVKDSHNPAAAGSSRA